MVLPPLKRSPTGRSRVPDKKKEPDTEGEELVLISGRVKESVRRRLRLYVAGTDGGESQQEVIEAALDAYLRKHGG